MSDHDAAHFWDERYAERDQIWSGRANDALVSVVSDLVPGRALDLGCGEGGDSVWLAEKGWRVTGVDVSAIAIDRARAEAARRGVGGSEITWIVEDLGTWEPSGQFDLVSACFLHSTIDLPRTDILRRAISSVAPAGHVLLVGHLAAPPWASEHAHHHHFATAEEELNDLALNGDEWERLIVGNQSRAAFGPDGERATLTDTVVFLRRR